MLNLTVMAGRLAVCRLGADAAVPAWAMRGGWWSVTRAAGELSVVCDEAAVPAGVRAERGWRALGVAGPLDFGMVGVLAALTRPLADAGVPVFVVSTFDTDYVLVREAKLAAAVAALRVAGCAVDDAAA